MDTIYAKRRWLMGATCQFHVQLSIHIQALIQGGVFDRFPGAKIIVGHLGENLVSSPLPDSPQSCTPVLNYSLRTLPLILYNPSSASATVS
jgi:hypothetical protein